MLAQSVNLNAGHSRNDQQERRVPTGQTSLALNRQRAHPGFANLSAPLTGMSRTKINKGNTQQHRHQDKHVGQNSFWNQVCRFELVASIGTIRISADVVGLFDSWLFLAAFCGS